MKEQLVKGNNVLYKTLGLMQKAIVIENDVKKQEIKIKLDYHKPTWVKYNSIEIIKEVK